MRAHVCLNADIGELPGAAGRALDAAILEAVSRCSIACGGHAGDAVSMAETLRMAKARGVHAGAHPSYPDREGFGRTRKNMSLAELAISLKAQVSDLQAIAAAEGVELRHIKPHGALYNDAAREADLARLVVTLCRESAITALLGPPASEMARAARRAGLTYIAEGFADRAYEADLSLTPRGLSGAVFREPAAQRAQALEMVLHHQVTARTGEIRPLRIDTLCLHGDTPGAAENAVSLRGALQASGISICP